MKNRWEKNIVLFLVSQTISLFGSALVQYAITWHITLEAKSGIMVAISIICGFLPTFFISPFSGVWADRYDRKKLIMLADAFIATATLVLAILFLNGYNSLWLLFIFSAIRALGTGIQTPAVSAFIPQLVPEDKLMKINSTNSSIQSLVMLLAPMISGVLLSKATIEMIFFIDVITAVVAILFLLLFLHVPRHAKASQQQISSYYTDLREGLAYINRHSYLKKLFFYSAVGTFLAGPAAFLTPLQVARSFGDQIWRLTAIEIAFSLGMTLGGITMAVWGGLKNKIHTIILGALLLSVTNIGFGVVPNFIIFTLITGICGIAVPIFNTPAMVLLQEKVAGDYLGRIFGVMSMIASTMMPLSMLIFGPLADLIKIEWLLIGTGILLFVRSLLLLGDKDLLRVGEANP